MSGGHIHKPKLNPPSAEVREIALAIARGLARADYERRRAAESQAAAQDKQDP